MTSSRRDVSSFLPVPVSGVTPEGTIVDAYEQLTPFWTQAQELPREVSVPAPGLNSILR